MISDEERHSLEDKLALLFPTVLHAMSQGENTTEAGRRVGGEIGVRKSRDAVETLSGISRGTCLCA